MTVTPSTLTRAAGVAAVAAGLIFIGVQINHPHLDATSITTTELAVRNSLKVLMAALALVGITGMYLHQVKQMGMLGLVGYLLFGANYLVIMGTSFVAAYILPSIAESNPSYVNDVLAAASNGHAHRRHRPAAERARGRGGPLPGWRPRLRHRAVPGPCPHPVGRRPPRRRRPRHRRAHRDAGRLLPAAGLPEQHRHDRPRLLALAAPHAHRDHARSRRLPAQPASSPRPVPNELAHRPVGEPVAAWSHCWPCEIPVLGRHRPARRDPRRPGADAGRPPLRRPHRHLSSCTSRQPLSTRCSAHSSSPPASGGATPGGTAERDGSLVALGLAVALSALWMTLVLPRKDGTGDLLYVLPAARGVRDGHLHRPRPHRHQAPRDRPRTAPG